MAASHTSVITVSCQLRMMSMAVVPMTWMVA